MAAKEIKEVKAQIEKDKYFIDKMRQMGEKWCRYPLVADALKAAEERLETNKTKLESSPE